MAKVTVVNMLGQQVGEMELLDEIFSVEPNEAVVHQVVKAYLANRRQGTQSALTRAEVRGGGRKPWRQKGTGRARQGSTRSPQWRHGGVVFAPKPRDYTQLINRKMKRLALRCALSAKLAEGNLVVLDALELPAPKTKEMVKVLGNIGVAGKAMVIIGENSDTLRRATNNIPGVEIFFTNTLNAYDVLSRKHLVVTREAMEKVQEVYAS